MAAATTQTFAFVLREAPRFFLVGGSTAQLEQNLRTAFASTGVDASAITLTFNDLQGFVLVTAQGPSSAISALRQRVSAGLVSVDDNQGTTHQAVALNAFSAEEDDTFLIFIAILAVLCIIACMILCFRLCGVVCGEEDDDEMEHSAYFVPSLARTSATFSSTSQNGGGQRKRSSDASTERKVQMVSAATATDPVPIEESLHSIDRETRFAHSTSSQQQLQFQQQQQQQQQHEGAVAETDTEAANGTVYGQSMPRPLHFFRHREQQQLSRAVDLPEPQLSPTRRKPSHYFLEMQQQRLMEQQQQQQAASSSSSPSAAAAQQYMPMRPRSASQAMAAAARMHGGPSSPDSVLLEEYDPMRGMRFSQQTGLVPGAQQHINSQSLHSLNVPPRRPTGAVDPGAMSQLNPAFGSPHRQQPYPEFHQSHVAPPPRGSFGVVPGGGFVHHQHQHQQQQGAQGGVPRDSSTRTRDSHTYEVIPAEMHGLSTESLTATGDSNGGGGGGIDPHTHSHSHPHARASGNVHPQAQGAPPPPPPPPPNQGRGSHGGSSDGHRLNGNGGPGGGGLVHTVVL